MFINNFINRPESQLTDKENKLGYIRSHYIWMTFEEWYPSFVKKHAKANMLPIIKDIKYVTMAYVKKNTVIILLVSTGIYIVGPDHYKYIDMSFGIREYPIIIITCNDHVYIACNANKLHLIDLSIYTHIETMLDFTPIYMEYTHILRVYDNAQRIHSINNNGKTTSTEGDIKYYPVAFRDMLNVNMSMYIDEDRLKICKVQKDGTLSINEFIIGNIDVDSIYIIHGYVYVLFVDGTYKQIMGYMKHDYNTSCYEFACFKARLVELDGDVTKIIHNYEPFKFRSDSDIIPYNYTCVNMMCSIGYMLIRPYDSKCMQGATCMEIKMNYTDMQVVCER